MKLNRDGVQLAYEEAGSGDSSIVMVHGAFADRTSYSEQFDHFAQRHRVIAVDLRGHGESDSPDEEYSIEGFAGDVVWMCEQLQVEEPVLVGHSLGGLVVVEMAGRQKYGSAVATLDSPSLIPGWTMKHPGKFDVAMRSDAFRETLRNFLAAAYLPVDNPVSHGQALDRIDDAPERSIHATWDALMRWDPASALEGLEAPFLYLDHGQPDVDLDLLRQYCPQMITGQTVGAGHRALQEVPEQVNPMLERFIRHAAALADYARSTNGAFHYTTTSE